MIKKIWSWKWRIVTLIIFVMAFLSRYEDGIIYATLNLMGVYAIYALGQFVADEIKSAGVYRIKPEPKPLSDEEIKQIWYNLYPLSSSSYWDDKREGLAELKFARAIEESHGIK